ncbi:MAG: cyclic nucleotide-binding domain-containing protein [Bacteroidota bacterium]
MLNKLTDILEKDPKALLKKFKKKEIIQLKGDTQAYTYYVKKGLLRSYLIDSKGKEHIFSFAPEGWVIADVESLEFKQEAELYIDCLEDSEVIIFDRDYLFNRLT